MVAVALFGEENLLNVVTLASVVLSAVFSFAVAKSF